jgi:hypothetical protein
MGARPKATIAVQTARLCCSGQAGLKVSQEKPRMPDYTIKRFDCISVQLILAAALSWPHEGVVQLNIIGCVHKDLLHSWRGLYKTRTLTD